MTQHPGWAPDYQRRREQQRKQARRRRRRRRLAGAFGGAVVLGVAVGWSAVQLRSGKRGPELGAVTTGLSTPQPTPAPTNTMTAVITPSTTAGDVKSNTGSTTRSDDAIHIVVDPIPYPESRRNQMAEYSLRHYGIHSSALVPKTIVLHFTENDSYPSTRNIFAANAPAPGPGGSAAEPPGTCSHYVVDQDGSIYEIVPPTLQCRHTIGLNRWAIGIELIQATHGNSSHWACQQILNRPAQVNAARDLVLMLQKRFAIETRDVIGHGTANESPYFRDRAGWRNDHSDWGAQDVAEFRALL